MERTVSFEWTVEFSEPEEMHGPTTAQVWVASDSGHPNDLLCRELLPYVPYPPAPVLDRSSICGKGIAERPPRSGICIAKALFVLRWCVCGPEGVAEAPF